MTSQSKVTVNGPEVLVVTESVFELSPMCTRSQLPSCQLPRNGASYVNLLGRHNQVTKKNSGLLQVPNKNYF